MSAFAASLSGTPIPAPPLPPPTPPTEQEFFDRTVEHLRVQGRQALNPHDGSCLYRGPSHTKCAAGVHIPDHLYEPRMECSNIATVLDEFPALVPYFPVGDSHRRLSSRLQRIHDNNQCCWEPHGGGLSSEGLRRLRAVAQEFGLSPAILDRQALVIPRDRWTGQGAYARSRGSACTPDAAGRQCCLGHYMSMVKPGWEADLGRAGMPDALLPEFQDGFPVWLFKTAAFKDVPATLALMNDAACPPELDPAAFQAQKEVNIAYVFDLMGVDVTFVDTLPAEEAAPAAL